MSRFSSVAALALIAFGAVIVRAEDAFYRVPVRELEITSGELPTRLERPGWARRERAEAMRPRVVLDGDGEAYFGGNLNRWSPNTWLEQGHVSIRVPERDEVTVRLTFPKDDFSRMTLLTFRVPADRADADARKTFYQAKRAYYAHLLERDLPGTAWFRHQRREAEKALGQEPDDVARDAFRGRMARRGPRTLADTYALFSGGRAISENLQLDRALPPLGEDKDLVAVDSIQGITIEEIDWKPLVKDKQPKIEPLARMIPADQQVVFFPSFSAAVKLADQVRRAGGLVTQLAQPRSEDQRVQDRYERQLALPLSALSRLLGPRLVDSVALTGSDPYFATGTDVAVVLESSTAGALEKLLAARVALRTAGLDDVKTGRGEIAGLAYRVVRTPDRRVCSYLAATDQVVIVTNSAHQLERLGATIAGSEPAVADLPEYRFFRDRYPRGGADESALVFRSDATIRRWCGPRWRIGASRRLRAAAVMAEVQASQMGRLAAGAEPGPVYTDLPTGATGELRLTHDAIAAEEAGTLAFLTPVAEMELDKVTKAEAEAYERWRDGYQRNWTWAFDPIALRVGIAPETLSADLTVMPLIWRTEYRQWIDISRGARIAPEAGDRHKTLAHAILAVDTESERFRRAGGMVASMARGVGLGWVGETVELYADPDPFWKEFTDTPTDQYDKFLQENFHRVPVAARLAVKSPMKLTMFLTATRAFIQETVPGMT
ncbi:MAG: hypothetical protein ACOC46_03615, partial [Pirellulales bacterium]